MNAHVQLAPVEPLLRGGADDLVAEDERGGRVRALVDRPLAIRQPRQAPLEGSGMRQPAEAEDARTLAPGHGFTTQWTRDPYRAPL